jgi:hypothetical protein
MMIHAGVDKVGLHSREYSVKSLAGWTEKGGRKVGEDPPVFLHDAHGVPIQGTGFHLNTDVANIDLSPKGLLISFNPSKTRHPYHLMTDTAEVGRVGDTIQSVLQRNGVLVNINSMHMVRVDLAKQRQLRHPLNTYGTALAHLKGKRMTGHQYPEGYSFRNTQREVVFYDKGRELYEKLDMAIPEQRLGRLEAKWKKGRPVSSDLKVVSFGDLRTTDPAHLTAVYCDTLHRDVFRTRPQAVQLVLNLDSEVDTLRAYIRAGRGGAMKYLMDMHSGPTVDALGGWDAFRELLLKAGMPERTARHTLQTLRTQAQRAAMVNARRHRDAVNVHTLLEELKQAYAA